MRRLFFALFPEDNTKQALQQISASLPLSSRQRVRAENWHVTLVFIGHVDETLVQKIIENTSPTEIKAITLVFDQLAYWHEPRILSLTCSQPELTINSLVTHLSASLIDLALKLDSRPYCPHVTLARHIHEKPTTVLNPVIWSANQFALVESISSPSGVIYQPLQFWQLAN